MNGRSMIKRVKRGWQSTPEGRGCRTVAGCQKGRGRAQRRVSFMNVFYCFRQNASGEQRRPDNSDGGTGKHKPAQKWEPLQAFSAARPLTKIIPGRPGQTRPTLTRNKTAKFDSFLEKYPVEFKGWNWKRRNVNGKKTFGSKKMYLLWLGCKLHFSRNYLWNCIWKIRMTAID